MRRLPLAATLALLTLAAGWLLGAGAVREARDLHAADQHLPPAPDPSRLPPAPGMRFGIDAEAVARFQQATGAPPDYGTVWVGKWNLDDGWQGTDSALVALHAANVTPAVQFWYWGDDMAPSCLTEGCNGKDLTGWAILADQLAQHLQQDLGGAPALVIVETEFNKGGVHQSEDLDGYLAGKCSDLKAAYPTAQTVLGLGDWWPDAWPTWDRAAAACDMVGLQALAASTAGDAGSDERLADTTLEGVQRLHALFGKPIVLDDVAVSSYPEPDHLEAQEQAIARFAAALPDLQAAGVQAVLYRSFLDVPDMALSNHFAEAERHWGLAWADTGQLKPAGQAWVTAIAKARAATLTPANP